MMIGLSLLAVSFCATLALTPLIRAAAYRAGHGGRPVCDRSVHERPVPRLGGVAMLVGMLAGFGVLMVSEPALLEAAAPGDSPLVLLSALVAVAGVGLIDDLWGLRPRVKLVAQGVVALGFVGAMGLLDAPTTAEALVAAGAVLWIVVVMNAVNLIDGLDGLAAGLALIALVALAVVVGSTGPALYAAIAAGAVGGFLVFNRHPASIFMGDTGSLLLGFSLAALPLDLLHEGVLTGPTLLGAVLVLGLPLLDLGLAIGRRLAAGRSPFEADGDHLHHRLLHRWGGDQRPAVRCLWGSGLLLGGLGIWAAHLSLGGALLVTAVALGLSAAGVYLLGYLGASTAPARPDRATAPAARRPPAEVSAAPLDAASSP
ncbi:MAG: MraY family glycosyltransferase [Bacteroidota bacterium]